MYLQGVSTCRVKAITEELRAHAFSASAISAVNKTLDESLERFAKRPLEETYPYLMCTPAMRRCGEMGDPQLSGRRSPPVSTNRGRRQILAVELANRESQASWRMFSWSLKAGG